MKHLLWLLFALPLMAQEPAAKPAETQEAPAAKADEQAPAAERWLTGSLDFGYRWVNNLGGDFNTYRSVVNLGEGPKLFGLDLSLTDASKRLFDRLEVRAHSWGGEPYNTARVDARREGFYQFSFDYRKIAFFNFLPSFADPTAERGIFLNQRAFDTYRRTNDFELDLFPGRRIVPYFAYSRNLGSGTGITDLVLDANEYPVRTRLYDRTDNYRGGLRFQFRRFHLTLEQGGINFADDQSVFATERNPGNVTTPVLGQKLFLASGSQAYHVRSDSLSSRGIFTANPVSWADLYGQFLYSRPHSDAHFAQQNSGNLLSFSALQFYTSQLDALSAEARRPHSSGSFSAELRPIRRLRVIESWMTDRLHNAASALLTEQLLVSGATLTPEKIFTSDRLVLNYNQQEVDVVLDLTSKLALRGGHRYVWGDAKAPAALVIERLGQESGELRRQVALAGANFRWRQKLSVNVDYEGSPGDRAYFRTSLNEYQKARMRARYQVLPSLLVSANFTLLRNQNPAATIDYDFLSRDNAASLAWTPGGGKWLSVLAEYSRSTLRSDIRYLVPSTLTRELSFYRERANTGLALVDLKLPLAASVQPKVSFGGSLFASCGSRPSRYYQPLARFTIPFGKHVEWNAEWRWYALSQALYLYEGFRSNQFLTSFRLIL
jgi:hypothetical protein